MFCNFFIKFCCCCCRENIEKEKDESVELLDKDNLDYMSDSDTELQRYFSPEDTKTTAFYREQQRDLNEDHGVDESTTAYNNNLLYQVYNARKTNSYTSKFQDPHLNRVFAGTDRSEKHHDKKVMKEINKLQRKGQALDRSRKLKKKFKLHKPKKVCCPTS